MVFDAKCPKTKKVLQQKRRELQLSRRQERRDPHRYRGLRTKMSERERGIGPGTKHPFPRYTSRTPTAEAVWGVIPQGFGFAQSLVHQLDNCL